ncbi:hypothetical protein PINS_up001050 [Pythium insidiosum]|nr:hypothetical protein PINS_up001050 [Pythium insidiosum]
MPATLRRLHANWLERLAQHTNRFLRLRAHTLLSQLAREVTATTTAAPIDDRELRRCGFDLSSFIAQSRQRCAVKGRGQALVGHRRRPCTDADDAHLWVCTTRDIGIRQDRAAEFDLSVLAILSCWRQLRCVRCRLEPAHALLSVASVFNDNDDANDGDGDDDDENALPDSTLLQLILDGRHRWFEWYPSGCATAGTTLDGLSMGDYVGRMTTTTPDNRLAARITTFAWPTASARDACALALHWTIVWPSTAAKGERVLVVDVEVKRASLVRQNDQAPDQGDVELAIESLRIEEKLKLVETWVPQCSLHLEYKPLERRHEASA